VEPKVRGAICPCAGVRTLRRVARPHQGNAGFVSDIAPFPDHVTRREV
jgi:hypothetical protein